MSTEEEVEEGESVDNSWRQKIKPGMTVRVYQYIREKDAKGNDKIRQQPFEGIIIAQKGGQQPEATFTVRKIGANGIGVEKIFPLYSPNIAQVKLIKQARVRRAKLFFLRNLKFKKKLKEKNIEE
ncbi:MAG: 50S ribosomal protein L19 [Patescibacteria group bacterium]|nr:50S ribosomal protein L19 [Patescibacteria group bacterium]